MNISYDELVNLRACQDGLTRFEAQTKGNRSPVEVTSLIGGYNTISDLVWLAAKTLPKERVLKFVCDCALLNIELIKPYTDSYDEIVELLTSPTDAAARTAARTAAYAAARAARAARAAADAAAYAAAYAARAAADAAAYAAADAADAADAAAYAAADAAAYAAEAPAYAANVENLLREMFA